MPTYTYHLNAWVKLDAQQPATITSNRPLTHQELTDTWVGELLPDGVTGGIEFHPLGSSEYSHLMMLSLDGEDEDVMIAENDGGYSVVVDQPDTIAPPHAEED